MWRREIWWLAAVTLVAGCTGSGPAQPGAVAGPAKQRQIAVIVKESTHEFWKSVHAGAERAAKELGNVTILWKAPTRGDDRAEQINIVQDFVTRGVDGVCLAPIDSRALVSAVRDARQAGIATVIFDSGLDDESLLVSYVATDNYNGGRLAARELGKRLKGKGNAILLRYNPGSESTEQRERGFLDTIAAEFPEITLVSSDQYAGVSEQTSLDKSQQLLLKFQDDLQGVFAVNESSATGMLRALEEAGLAGKVVYIGFDSSPRMVQALRDGKIQGIVLQDPVTMGYLSVKTMADHLDGKPVEKRVGTGEAVATAENIDEPRIHTLLFPEQFSE